MAAQAMSRKLLMLTLVATVGSACSEMVAPSTSAGNAAKASVSGIQGDSANATANPTGTDPNGVAGTGVHPGGGSPGAATPPATTGNANETLQAGTSSGGGTVKTELATGTNTVSATGAGTGDTTATATSVGKLTIATNALKDFAPNSTYGYYTESTVAGHVTKSVSITIGHTDGVTSDSLKKRVEKYDCHDCDAAAPRCACQDKGTPSCSYKQISVSFTGGFPDKDAYPLKGDSSDYAGKAIVIYTDGSVNTMLPKGSLTFSGTRPAKVDDPYTADVDFTFAIVGGSPTQFKSKLEGSIYSLVVPTTTPPTCKANQYLEPIYATN